MIFPALLSTNPSSSPRLSLLTQLMSQNLNPQYRMHAISPQPTQHPSRIQDAFRWFLQLKEEKKNKKKIPTTRFIRRVGDLIFGERHLALLLR